MRITPTNNPYAIPLYIHRLHKYIGGCHVPIGLVPANPGTQRIIRPLNTGDKMLGKVDPSKMAEIDKKIAKRYLSSIDISSASN